jgi:hypothetical protein
MTIVNPGKPSRLTSAGRHAHRPFSPRAKPTEVAQAYAGSDADAALPLGDDADGRIPAAAYEPDARARAILRGRKHAEADLRAAGGAYDLDDVRALLNNISRQAIDKRVHEGALLAVPGPSGRRRFPTAQFDRHGNVVTGLKAVSDALGFASSWAVLNFLVNANDGLAGRRPIDVLQGGEVEPVVAAAARIGIQGA